MMTDQKPILIAGPPRCGTTMLAGLLIHHGVWVGRARKTLFPGSNSDLAVENQDIKTLMKREAMNVGYRNWTVPLPKAPACDFETLKAEIEAFVPDETQWLVKTSWTAAFFEFWSWAYPGAIWVLPWRKKGGIYDSMKRHPRMKKRPDPMKKQFINALQERQAEIHDDALDAIWVDVKMVSMLDEDAIKKYLEHCGLQIDWEKVGEWIEPGKMK